MLSFQALIAAIPLVLLSLDMNLKGKVGPSGMYNPASLSALFIVAWTTLLNQGVECALSQAEVEQHLEMGKKMLAAGQLADALSHYHAAVEGDPMNYMTYYRRATVYLAMGKSKSALPDLDKVIDLKPDFTAARLQRGNVKMKQGKLREALVDYNEILETNPSNEEAKAQANLVMPLEEEKAQAQMHYEEGEYQTAIDIATHIIEKCPWDPELREIRAECYIAQGEYFKAIGDIRPCTKLRSDNTAAYYKLSILHYQMGEAEESLLEIRECLKLDPDHKDCFPHYKKVKKLVKQMQSIVTFLNEQKWEDCVSKADSMLKTESELFEYVLKAMSHKCHCNAKAKNYQASLDSCNEVLGMDENNVDALCDRAEAYLVNEQYDEAISDYRKANEIDSNLKRVQEGMKRAEKLLKQSQKRDYYKILGLKRNAKKRDIVKAYRKLAAEYHPDQYKGEDKERAEKMFIDIAAAKEVLSDPEKREKFDNGEDPLDPEEQAQGGHPFHGFNPFGGGGFQFKFHFN